MREIKFRAWQEDAVEKDLRFWTWKEMLEHDLNAMVNSPKYKIMQYTGLKDKNDKEIYEGDVVSFCDFASDRTGGHMGDSIVIGVVSYDYAMWFIKDNQNDEVGFPLCDAHLNDDEFEVIGNIYENPELLEGEFNANKL